MKPRHTLALLGALIALILLYLGMIYRQELREEEQRQARMMFDFAAEEIIALTIDPIDDGPCAAERVDEETWRMVAPNPTIIPFHRMWNRVSLHLSNLVNEHTVLSKPGDLAQYGLDLPALTVQAGIRGGKSVTLRLGDLEPTQRHRYAQIDEGPLFLVSAEAFFELNRSLTDLRHRFLVRNREAPLLEMEFAWVWSKESEDDNPDHPKPGDESVLVKVRRDAPDAPWQLTSPETTPANHEAVQTLANELQFAVCTDFIDEPGDLVQYGLQPHHARLAFRDGQDGKLQTLYLGSVDTSPEGRGLFTKVDGQDAVLIIDGHLLTLLPRSPLEWRDLRLVTQRASRIRGLRYATEHDTFALERDGEGAWQLTSPVLENVNHAAVSGFLSFINEVAGESFVDVASNLPIADTPVARITIHYDNDKDAEIAVYSIADGSEKYVASQDTGALVYLTPVAADILLTDSEAFRSREIMRFFKQDIEEVEFSLEGAQYHLGKRHNRWVVLAPETGVLQNQSDVDMLLDAINPLFALRMVEDGGEVNPAQYGFDSPAFLLLARDGTGGTAKEYRIEIGAANPDNPSERFARTSARAGVFVVGQEAMDQIREAMRGFR